MLCPVWIDWSVETTYKIEERFVKKKIAYGIPLSEAWSKGGGG
jgi:hypothetical protein